jgi:hypothetical protein
MVSTPYKKRKTITEQDAIRAANAPLGGNSHVDHGGGDA